MTPSSSLRRFQVLREHRQRLSEQRDYPLSSASGGSSASSARLQALAEFDTTLAESEAKRRRQAEENRLNSLKDDENELLEKRREKFRMMFDDENRKYESKVILFEKRTSFEDKGDSFSCIESKREENELNNHRIKNTYSIEDHDENILKDEESDSDQIQKSSIEYDVEKPEDIELIAFTVRCKTVSFMEQNQDENNSLVRLFCQWVSPSSSSAIDYFTIEHQLGDQEWLPIGDKIDKFESQSQLDISIKHDDNSEMNLNIPSYFRLKVHLQNGQTFVSKPTDKIFMNLLQKKNIIIPEVEILSSNSVQLTCNDNENQEKSNIYDIEKKESQQPAWEKMAEIPLSQCSARIDNLTDAEQCQFRLISSSSEPENTRKIRRKKSN